MIYLIYGQQNLMLERSLKKFLSDNFDVLDEFNLIKYWLSLRRLLLCPLTHLNLLRHWMLPNYAYSVCLNTVHGTVQYSHRILSVSLAFFSSRATSFLPPTSWRTTKYWESNQCISSARGQWLSNHFLAFLSAKPRYLVDWYSPYDRDMIWSVEKRVPIH